MTAEEAERNEIVQKAILECVSRYATATGCSISLIAVDETATQPSGTRIEVGVDLPTGDGPNRVESSITIFDIEIPSNKLQSSVSGDMWNYVKTRVKDLLTARLQCLTTSLLIMAYNKGKKDR